MGRACLRLEKGLRVLGCSSCRAHESRVSPLKDRRTESAQFCSVRGKALSERVMAGKHQAPPDRLVLRVCLLRTSNEISMYLSLSSTHVQDDEPPQSETCPRIAPSACMQAGYAQQPLRRTQCVLCGVRCGRAKRRDEIRQCRCI